MDEAIGKDGGGVVVLVVVVAVGVGVGVVVAAVVGGGTTDCIEANWGDGTREGTVEAEGVGVGGPTFEIGEDNCMGTFVDRGQNRKRRWRSGVVAGQGAWMVANRCGREIEREGFDGVVAD